jgi:O-antigen ligase
VALALVPVVFAIGLALSERGLGGSISDGVEQLFDPSASAAASPSNDPGRLTAVGSVRARYFADSLEIFEDRPLLGAGAGGFATARPQVRPDELDVRHAHGFVFQTLADLGIAGMAVVLALLAAWSWAALRATALLRRRGTPRPVVDAELVGLRTLLAVVVVFGVHSFVDWTWFIPGTTVLALLCAGWLAGRGPSRGGRGELLLAPPGRYRRGPGCGSARGRSRGAGLLVVTAACVWATYQPLRSRTCPTTP